MKKRLIANVRLGLLVSVVLGCLIQPAITAELPAVTLEFKDADLRDVLHMLSKHTGVSVVLGGTIEGTITANLVEAPFENALRTILSTTSYEYFWEDGAVVVDSKTMASRVMNVYYVDASTILLALEKLVTADGSIKAIERSSVVDERGKAFSNKLIIVERAGLIDDIVALVHQIDTPPRQVRIEAKLVETVLGDDEKLGIKWNLAGSMTGAIAPTTFPFPKNSMDGGDFSATPDPGDPQLYQKREFPPGEYFPYANKEDFSFGAFSVAEFNVLLQAISLRRNTNLVASPTVMALDNEPAEILVGEQIPIALYERQRETGVMEIIGYESQNVGVNLWVVPHIGQGDSILLEIIPETSSIINFIGQFNERPVTATRMARTQVLVKDGETVVIGGLIKETNLEIVSRVPFLGRIPLLGRLFTHRSVQKEKMDLLIFITPTIIKG
jgi:type II secretory pathway component GspD/PulD (secretin)